MDWCTVVKVSTSMVWCQILIIVFFFQESELTSLSSNIQGRMSEMDRRMETLERSTSYWESFCDTNGSWLVRLSHHFCARMFVSNNCSLLLVGITDLMTDAGLEMEKEPNSYMSDSSQLTVPTPQKSTQDTRRHTVL